MQHDYSPPCWKSRSCVNPTLVWQKVNERLGEGSGQRWQWTMLIQSHWSQWLISQNLRTFSCLERTWLGQLAVSLSPAEPRICRFCMCGSLNSACIWLIDEICRQVVFCNCHPEWDQQKLRIQQKQKWSMESCWSWFRVQMHKPLVHDSPRPNTTG